MYVSEICAEGIFVTFPWCLKNVKSRSKIVLFSNERHFEIWFPKKRTIITFFWSKLSKLHKKRLNFACGNYIFPKTRGNKNKPWTHSTLLKDQGAPPPLLGPYTVQFSQLGTWTRHRYKLITEQNTDTCIPFMGKTFLFHTKLIFRTPGYINATNPNPNRFAWKMHVQNLASSLSRVRR